MVKFFFDPKKGETPEQLARQRAAAEAYLNSSHGVASNIGEGLAQLGAALGARFRMSSADSALKAGDATAAGKVSPLINAYFGGGNVAQAPSPAAAKPVAASMGKPAMAPTDIAQGIKATADALGIDPVALGTAISYETAGTFNPTKPGPRTQWGQHRGLIQFGEPQARKYGVDWKNPIGSQLGANGAVATYLRDAGVKPGMGLMDIYSAINAGGVGRYNRSDAGNGGAPGTVADKVNNQMAGHAAKAKALLASLTSAAPVTQPPETQQAASPVEAFLGPKPRAQPVPPPMPQQVPQIMPAAAPPEMQVPIAPQANPRNPQGLTSRQIRFMMEKGNQIDPGRIPFLKDAVNAPQMAQQAAPQLPGVPAPEPVQQAPLGAPMAAPQGQPAMPGLPQINPAQLMQLAQDPWVMRNPIYADMVKSMLEQQMKSRDPATQMAMEKARLELENLKNPKLSPADEARINLDREKFKWEQGKPIVAGGDSRIYDPTNKSLLLDAVPKEKTLPAGVQEYEYAKSQGFPGTFADWEASKKGAMEIRDGETGNVIFRQGSNLKPMTEAQSKDTIFATRAEGALRKLEPQANALTSPKDAWGGAIPGIGNYIKSDAYQNAEQAGTEFLQAILRKDTGAAITPAEQNEYGKVYLPIPGDGPEVLLQKQASRSRAVKALKAGMTPQAILAQENALRETDAVAPQQQPAAPQANKPPPPDVDPELWKLMTPEERALWQ